jgi:hypothetical protein
MKFAMKNLTVLLVIILVCLAIACGYAIGIYLSASIDRDTGASCPNTMADIVQSVQGNVYEAVDPNYIDPTLYDLVTYSVNGDEIINPVFDTVPNNLKDEQQNSALQKEAWQIFATLIPAKDRQIVSQYKVFTDGFEETLAMVDLTEGDLTHWIVEVDIADLEDKNQFMFTLIHEYAHLLTLNASQVTADQEALNDLLNDTPDFALVERKTAACPEYFTGGGCSLPNSYVNAFYDRFWLGINAEWKKIDLLQYESPKTLYYASLFNFYKAHQDQFVDDYSTAHPTEDIAESFTYFVFSPKPVGNSIKEQKIAFFYEYPELVELRRSILNSVCLAIQ